ncbi:hypothetical protein ACVWZ6_008121 [Bradyrhizobium sp. GM6.1]
MTKDHPALVALMSSRWDNAFGHLHHASEKTLGQARAQRLLDVCGDRRRVQAEIHDTVDALYAVGTRNAGQLALAWEMLTCNPRIPTTLHRVLPQLQHALDAADLDADLDVDVRERLSIWWAAGAGDYVKVTRSMFAVAVAVLAGEIETESALEPFEPVDVAQFFRTPYAGPTLTVMPAAKATKLNNYNKVFQDILDKPLPLVCARDLAEARKRLEYEFPHASAGPVGAVQGFARRRAHQITANDFVGLPGCFQVEVGSQMGLCGGPHARAPLRRRVVCGLTLRGHVEGLVEHGSERAGARGLVVAHREPACVYR